MRTLLRARADARREDDAQDGSTTVPYVDLERTFSAASEGGDDEDYLAFFRKQNQPQQSWTWLTTSRIAVILNEAGAGKTKELRAEVARQRAAGRSAFLFPIERLCAEEPEAALPDEDERAAFRRWRWSRKPATVFLDSVDEAKLPQQLSANPLNTAIRRIEANVGKRFGTLSFVISSRPSAWSKDLELAEIHRLQDRFKSFGTTEGQEGAPLVRFVRIDPLDASQVSRLAQAAGADDRFMSDLIRAGAVELATTPLDVLDFVSSHKEMVEHHGDGAGAFDDLSGIVNRAIERRAIDLDASSPRTRLPLGRVRGGARRLALACVLGQTMSIRSPGGSGAGLDPLAVLSMDDPDWSLPDVRQLLGGGLFTAAWEGAVRFHHRRSMERLAAEALDELLRAGMALADLAEIVTPSAFGVASVPRHLLETVGWLGTLNKAFREYLLGVAPQLLMELGDPGSLTLDARRRALRAHVARYDEIAHRGEWFPAVGLRRFGAPGLEADCRDLLSADGPDEPKGHLLDLAARAGLSGCLDVIVSIACDPHQTPTVRTQAVEAATAFATPADLRRITLAMLAFPTPHDLLDGHDRYSRNRLRSAVVVACFPAAMSLREAMRILLRLEHPDRRYVSTNEQELARAFVAACPPGDLRLMVRWLERLCWERAPYRMGGWSSPRWTPRGRYLLPTLEAACARYLAEVPEASRRREIAVVADKLSNVRRVGGGPLERYDQQPDPVALRVVVSPEFRRTIFLAALEADDGRLEPYHVVRRLTFLRDHSAAAELARQDLDWLEALYREGARPAQTSAILAAAREALSRLPGRERRARRRPLWGMARRRGEHRGLADVSQRLDRWVRNRVRRWWWDQPFVRRPTSPKRIWRSATFHLALRRQLGHIRSGDQVGWLYRLVRAGGETSKASVTAYERYGPKVGEAVREGLKGHARRHMSRNDSRQTVGDYVAAAGWAQIALDEPGAMDHLSDDQFRSLLTVVLKDTGFPDWAARVCQRHPGLWAEVVAPRLRDELGVQRPPGAHRHSPTLSLAGRADPALKTPLAVLALPALEAAVWPSRYEVLDAGRIVRSEPSMRPSLARLCETRARPLLFAGEVQEAAPWIGVWLAVDPAPAWAMVRAFRDGVTAQGEDVWVQRLFGSLGSTLDVAGLPVGVLGQVALDFHLHIRAEEDDERSGAVTDRHQAQDIRNGALRLLSKSPTPEARAELLALRQHPAFAGSEDWIARLLLDQAQEAASKAAWAEREVADFTASWLRRPRDADEFQALITRHLIAIVRDLHTSEFDRRGLFKGAAEKDMRAFFGDALQSRSQGWYAVTQESVTAGENRTDLRLEATTKAGEVVIVELKVAGRSWTADELVEHLESQLVKQYLISRKVRRGVYAIIDLHHQKTWQDRLGAKLTFEEICDRLETEAARLGQAYPQVDALVVLPLQPMAPR